MQPHESFKFSKPRLQYKERANWNSCVRCVKKTSSHRQRISLNATKEVGDKAYAGKNRTREPRKLVSLNWPNK